MSGTFVPEGNVSVFPEYTDQVKIKMSVEEFELELRNRGVYSFELVWKNYVRYYYEIPEYLMSLYLKERPRLLHPEALAEAKRIWKEGGMSDAAVQ